MFSYKQGKISCDLDAMDELLSSSIEIRYNLAMESIKKESKKKGLVILLSNPQDYRYTTILVHSNLG